MATLSATKIVATYLGAAVESYESQQSMLPLVKVINDVDPATLQNGNNTIWRKVVQQGASIPGFDLTGLETGIISQGYSAYLGTPENTFVGLRVDDLRDLSYIRDQAEVDGKKRASVLNKAITDTISTTGSMAYRSNVTSGFDFVSLAQAGMNKRQSPGDQRYIGLTDTHNQKFGKDLASRQTLQAQPADTFKSGMLYNKIAGFDVMVNSSVSLLPGGANPATTVTANVSFAPLGGTATNGGVAQLVVTNNDYRFGTIAVTASASYNVGDRVTFSNSAVTVKAIGRDDKTVTDEAMVFTIVAKPSGTSVTLWPRPIALNDAGITVADKAYANINTQILNTATMDRVNIDATTQPSIFWEKNSIEVLGGKVPMELLGQWGGMKVATERLSNGLNMYMLYDGNIANLQARWRMFIWYGVNNARPADNGILISY
jgi:hypothetical protein